MSWGWNSGGPSWAQRPNPSPSLAPMKSGISRSVADDKSVSVCPRLFPGPGEDPGWGETETQTQRPRDGSFGGHWGQPVYTALTSDPSRDQTLSHPWHCGRVSGVCLWQGWHGSAGGTEALLPCYCWQSLQMDDAFKLWKCQRTLRIHETTEDIILCTILVCRLEMFWVILCLIVLFIVALDYILMNYKSEKFQEKVWIFRLHWLSRCLCYLKLCPLFLLSCTSNTNDSGPLITGSWTVSKKVKVK